MPKNITAFSVSWDAIQVKWAPLDRKQEVNSYEVQYCSFIDCNTMEVNDHSVLVKGLPQYTSFTIKVRGRNAKYTGPWAISRELKTLGQYSYLIQILIIIFIYNNHITNTVLMTILCELSDTYPCHPSGLSLKVFPSGGILW